jgi:single-strand DNA-binding protein
MEEPLAYSVEEAAGLLGISRTKAYECVREGQLRAIEIGHRLLVPAAALEELLGDHRVRTRHRTPGKQLEEGTNSVEAVGRLTRDGDLRSTRAGSTLCPLRLAIRRRHGDDAVFVDVVIFGQEANRAARLRRGQLVWVLGRLDQREWTAEDGSRREAYQIVASRIEALDAPRPEDRPSGENGVADLTGEDHRTRHGEPR